ncbi:hypothetical protein B0H12DRAFT_1103955 [Mycena haematopus]|nr:hypothetical protein B0H12DRAFT_1103955 [Mycena haematopus]
MRYLIYPSSAVLRLAIMNAEKLQHYQALSKQQRDELLVSSYHQHSAWVGDLSSTCEQALELCERIPPVILEGSSTQTKSMSKAERNCPLHRVALVENWFDTVVASTNFTTAPLSLVQRVRVSKAIDIDRCKPVPEPTERDTNNFHLKFILEPATAIASVVKKQELSAGYAAFSDGVTGDLRVHAEDNKSHIIIVAEDKRGLVWAEHEAAVLKLLAQGTVPVVGPEDDPPAAVRICYQINAQMHTYKVFYAKLFSPSGVMYVRRDAGSRLLQFSQVYHTLDGEVRRTACLIIEALNHPMGILLTPALSLSGLSTRLSTTWSTCAVSAWIRRWALQFFLSLSAISGVPTLAIGPDEYWSLFRKVDHSLPFSSGIFAEFVGAGASGEEVRPFSSRIFAEFVGAGASGKVWRSTDGTHVIKIFTDACAAHTEAKVLARCVGCPGLAVPTFLGLFTDGQQLAIVTPYVGKTIGTISGASKPQRRQLIEVLRQLHARGIHHHDIRPENVMVNDAGVVTLVDFDRARWVDGPCPNCSDFEVLASMERETTGDSGHTLDNSAPSFDNPAASYL